MIRVIADENMPAVEALLGDAAEVIRVDGRALTAGDVRQADVLFVRSVTPVGRELLSGSAVRFVGTATSGTDHVDLAWLQERDIGFARAAGANANSVVEYVLSALANAGQHLEGLFDGGRLGVVGYGYVGRAVAARFRALGVRCLVYDPWLQLRSEDGAASLEQILACDVISLHCELTHRRPWPSHHLLSTPELRSLQAGQMLINASRGSVVDNGALKTRLSLPDAPEVALDVWEGEPELDLPLLEAVTFGTAHIAGYSLDGKIMATRMLCRAAADRFGLQLPPESGVRPPTGPLNLPRLEGGPAAAVRHLMLQRYDIREDDALLRGACRTTDGPLGPAFDRLRRDYVERYELAGSAVTADDPGEASRAIVRALGCEMLP